MNNIVNNLLSIIKGWPPDTITLVILITIFVLTLCHVFFKKDFKSIIISIGIFGTFSGILIGLLNFNTGDVTSSVPFLLRGLKTAFVSSVFGMLASILLNIGEKISNQTNSESSVEDLLKAQIEEFKMTNEHIKSIKMYMKDSTKGTQENLSTINKSLKTALEKMSEGASKQIIKALEDVIKDFNNNLTEQFGDNFKQLNEAVSNMILWQKNYKSSIEKLDESFKISQDKFEKSVDNLEKNAKYTENLSEKYEKISRVGEDLSKIIQTNENQVNNLTTHMENLKKIGDDASIIVKSIEDFSKTIQGSLSNQSQGLNNLQENLNKSLNTLNESLTSLTDKFRKDYQAGLSELEKIFKKVG